METAQNVSGMDMENGNFTQFDEKKIFELIIFNVSNFSGISNAH